VGTRTSYAPGTFSWVDLATTDVGAAKSFSEDMRATGATPNWMSYVTVTDADDAAARRTQVGGGVIDEAFDVLDLGRIAVVVDP